MTQGCRCPQGRARRGVRAATQPVADPRRADVGGRARVGARWALVGLRLACAGAVVSGMGSGRMGPHGHSAAAPAKAAGPHGRPPSQEGRQVPVSAPPLPLATDPLHQPWAPGWDMADHTV